MLALALVAALLSPDELRLPPNISVPDYLVDAVADAIRASPTLRQQVEHVGRIKRLRVQITFDPPDPASGPPVVRAYTDIRRFQFGSIKAAVHLISRRDLAEMLAHELEHVREYADGINYQAESLRRPHAVWRIGENTYETARAVLVGRTVAGEIGAVAMR